MLQRFYGMLPRWVRCIGAADVWQAVTACLLATAGSEMFSPFGPAAVAGAWLLGPFPFAALAGALFGALIKGHYRAFAAAALYAGTGLLLQLWHERLNKAEKLALLGGCELVLLPFFSGGSPQNLLMGTAALSLGMAAALLIGMGSSALRSLFKGKGLSRRSRRALFLFLLLLTAALPAVRLTVKDTSPFGKETVFFLGAAFSAFLALCAVETRGQEGVAAAVLFGAAAMLQGADIARTGMLALAALGAALAAAWGRWAKTGVFLGISLAASVLFRLPWAGFLEMLLGTVGFLLFEGRCRKYLLLLSGKREQGEAERLLALTRARLRGAADVIRALSDVFSPMADELTAFTHRQLSGVSGVMERLAAEAPLAGPERYSVCIGSAACPKAGNAENGDSMAQRRIGSAQLLILSDGMGTGVCAKRESGAAVDLFGDLLSVGFAPEEAEECVNRLLMVRGEREMYATLDALLIDLADGRARFIKYGAPPAYILRGGKVHTVYAEALPIGILEEASPSVQEVQLKRGDTVVMMTDGLFDALGAALFASLLEQVGENVNAEDAAHALLSLGKRVSGTDDMSVFVAKIA